MIWGFILVVILLVIHDVVGLHYVVGAMEVMQNLTFSVEFLSVFNNVNIPKCIMPITYLYIPSYHIYVEISVYHLPGVHQKRNTVCIICNPVSICSLMSVATLLKK